METYTFPHLAGARPDLQEAHVALFPSIPNGAELRARLIAAATSSAPAAEADAEREAVNFAFIDAAMVMSLQQLVTAIHQALIVAARGNVADGIQGGMKSATIHGEVIYSLHPAANIGEALRNFGVGPQTKHLLVVRISGPSSAAQRSKWLEQMSALAQGAAPDSRGLAAALPQCADLPRIRKAYKLNDPSLAADVRDDPIALEKLVVSTIAMKSVAA